MFVKDRCMFLMSMIFGLQSIAYIQGTGFSFTIGSNYTLKGSPASLQCTVNPLIGTVSFEKDSIIKGRCTVPNNPLSCSASVTQSGDTTYFNITSLNYTQHNGEWTCVNSGTLRRLNLTVYSSFDSSSFTSSKTEVSSGDIVQATCQMKCQYPIDSAFTSIAILKSDNTIVQSITSYNTSTPSANDRCEGHEKNLEATFTLSSTDVCGNAELYCQFDNNVLGTNTSTTLNFKFPGCEITTTDIPTTADEKSTTGTYTDQSTTMHAITSTTVPPTTNKSPLTEEEILILVVSVSAGLFLIIVIVIIVVCLVRKYRQERKTKTKERNVKGSKAPTRNETRSKYSMYSDDHKSSHKQEHYAPGHPQAIALHYYPNRSSEQNYPNQRHIVQGNANKFEDGQYPFHGERDSYPSYTRRDKQGHDRGYGSPEYKQSYQAHPARSKKLYPTLQQQQNFYDNQHFYSSSYY